MYYLHQSIRELAANPSQRLIYNINNMRVAIYDSRAVFNKIVYPFLR